MCVNSDGSFLCECGNGFNLAQDGKLCNGMSNECIGHDTSVKVTWHSYRAAYKEIDVIS